MDNFLEQELKKPEYHAIAIANFIFREIIEEEHSKYNISQDDMREMCKNAVNNAQFCLELFSGSGHFDTDDTTHHAAIQRFVFLQGMYGISWDAPVWTEEHQQLFHILTAEL